MLSASDAVSLNSLRHGYAVPPPSAGRLLVMFRFCRDRLVFLVLRKYSASPDSFSQNAWRHFDSSPASPGHSGWNMVALFAAAHNSPCSCPFSVSLHPAQRALNSEPQEGAFWNGKISEFNQTKSCPRWRGIRAERVQWTKQRGENRAE